MRNLHRRFDWHYIGQIYGGDFPKFCGLLKQYDPHFRTVLIIGKVMQYDPQEIRKARILGPVCIIGT